MNAGRHLACAALAAAGALAGTARAADAGPHAAAGAASAAVPVTTVPGVAASAQPRKPATYTPPPDAAIPDDDFGKAVRLGREIFTDTGRVAGAWVGNSLRCVNCHLDAGRLADASPLWAAYVSYPAFRKKTGDISTFAERLQGCFMYSMDGKAPPLGDKVLVALESYAFFLAKGAPVGTSLPGRGYPAPKAAQPPDRGRGAAVYAQKCAICHGADGQGQASHGTVVFPPLWGPKSYNWGAGMSVVKNAAGFIKANMPLGQGNTLTDQEAWDVALYVDSHDRPQDPRYAGSVEATRRKHHDGIGDLYGQVVDGVTLGSLPLRRR